MTKTEVTLNGQTMYITPTGYRAGTRGKVLPPAELYRQLPKGQRRKLRKAARATGHIRHAAAV